MKIINKTPHDVNVINKKGEVYFTFESDGSIRLAVKIIRIGAINGIPMTETFFGEPEGLPVFEHETFYIVSQLVKNALPKRTDLLVPAEVVRDGKGKILGCKSLGV